MNTEELQQQLKALKNERMELLNELGWIERQIFKLEKQMEKEGDRNA